MPSNSPILSVQIIRLTALWALIESGIGAYMHALEIPFTGIVLGGSAIVILSLIAWYCQNKASILLQSLLIVLSIKFLVSPHSPPPAYLAVAFQGLMAIVCFALPLPRVVQILVFFLLAMWESAIQKFIVATLLYGSSLWEALDKMVASIAKDLSIHSELTTHFTWTLIGTYILLYTLWALVLWRWTLRLPERIEREKTQILKRISENQSNPRPLKPGKRKGSLKWIGVVFILAFLSFSFFLEYSKEQALLKSTLSLARTLSLLIVFLYVVPPLLRKLLSRLQNRMESLPDFQAALGHQAELRTLVPVTWQLAKAERNWWRRYAHFMLSLLVLALYHESTDTV
ncbi:MAG: hypothetical protein EP332_07545 [Bacteroidetes bacterium]|nr:MAG: hypothetical protein EP332_07545 [Bacteroidota bacterium]